MFSEHCVKQIHKCWVCVSQRNYHHCKYLPILFITPRDANRAYLVDVNLEVGDTQLKGYQELLFNHIKYACKQANALKSILWVEKLQYMRCF